MSEEQKLYQQSIKETLINTKDAVFSIVDDIVNDGFKEEYFTKNNRLYYLGIFLIIIVIIFMTYNSFVGDTQSTNSTPIIVRLERD